MNTLNTTSDNCFIHKLIFLFLTVFLFSCQENNLSDTKKHNKAPVDLTKNIGWLHNNCLAIKNDRLNPGNKIIVVSFEEEQKIYSVSIEKKVASSSICPQLLEGRKAVNISEGYSFYLIKQGTSKLDLGIGLVDINPKLQKSNGQIVGDINNDALLDYFTQRSSSEGIHFSIWSSQPYQGEPLWTGYYYLGYDLEPNCPQ